MRITRPLYLPRPNNTFASQLDAADYDRLFKLTIALYRRQHLGKPDPDMQVIEGMMNEFGPKAQLELIRQQMEKGNI
jgi:hypothetical protein